MYSLIEPEMSSSATSGGGFTIAAELSQIDDLAAAAQAAAQRAAHVEAQASAVR